MKRWLSTPATVAEVLIVLVLFGACLGDTLARFDPNPPRGIDCDWCRYYESIGETI